ncbi:monooxygenase [Neisseria sp. CCUG17229]|uniref:Monooxygenase n=1 Tax=Neisseria brasiliensis TaxID=2666100 RepID=A0A5Q3RYN7_9NEIS|nr:MULTISPECIES: monooxygenase [Neisseria]MRN37927.1 monooxygenase [Neisseria brasiliensis]PJO09665.1 monooxygenase [Neisseria sp. N95_16]PJO78054.1 monooxygenase [Neisseria sp. N177_16]QGL24875.1 monooxygenase [Neisseria brasiliensis]
MFILQVDFPYQGPWGEEMAAEMKTLAESIAQEPGLIWKFWTENQAAQEAGGIYYFATEQDAQNYLTMHTARLKSFGVPHVNGKIFAINTDLSKIDNAPL